MFTKNLFQMIFSCLMLSVFSLCGVSISQAQNTYSSSAQFLAEVGEEDYKKGNLDRALHEFSKALMLDPHNRLARSYLKRFGLEEGIYKNQRTAMSRLTDLAREINTYQNYIGHLDEQQEDIYAHFRQLNLANSVEYEKNKEKLKAINELQGQIHQQTIDITEADARKMLVEMMHRIDVRRQSNELLQSMGEKSDFLEYELLFNKVNMEKYRAIDAKLWEYIQEAKRQEKKIQELSLERNDLNESLTAQKSHTDHVSSVLEDYITVHRARLHDVSNELVVASIDLSQKNDKLNTQSEDLVDLQTTLKETIQKLDEKNKMIELKNQQIHDLQTRFYNDQKKTIIQ